MILNKKTRKALNIASAVVSVLIILSMLVAGFAY